MRARIVVDIAKFLLIGIVALACAGCVSWLFDVQHSMSDIIDSPSEVQMLKQEIRLLKQEIDDLNQDLKRAPSPCERKAREAKLEENTAFVRLNHLLKLCRATKINQLLDSQMNASKNEQPKNLGPGTDTTEADCTNSSQWIKLNPIAPFHPKRIREVLDWESFDRGFIYSWRRYWRINGHMGNLRTELQQAISSSKHHVDTSVFAWQHGQFQLDTRRGMTYLMDFESKKKPIRYKRIQMFRPMSTTVLKGADVEDTQQRLVHLILPLQGRSATFAKFIIRLEEAVLSGFHAPFFLTVVYFTSTVDDQRSNHSDVQHADVKHTTSDTLDSRVTGIKNILQHAHERADLRYRIILRNESFRRGLGLEVGSENDHELNIPNGVMEPVLFFCDVDMKFTSQFLYRCRQNAEPGKQVYFPISFSLFKTAPNSSVVHANGDWRKYGLGMVCISRSDFHGTSGFSKKITGWGREDVEFYERMLSNTSLSVIRAVDEGLIHTWHPKVCDIKALSRDQMGDCISSQADWEGDKASLMSQLFTYQQQFGLLKPTTPADTQHG